MAPLTLHHDARALAAQYRDAEPFPHIALDGLFDDDALDAVLREFPSPRGDALARVRLRRLEKKLGYYHETSTHLGNRPRRFSTR